MRLSFRQGLVLLALGMAPACTKTPQPSTPSAMSSSGTPDHDAGVVADLLGPVPVAGAFCAGELGPVGAANHIHGFTASLALF